jgi:integrase
MRGHIRKRGERSWAVVVELDRDASGKRRQQWHTVRGTKDDAETKLTALLSDLDRDLYVAPTKLTVGDYLDRWLEIKRPELGGKTFERYNGIVKLHLIPAFGRMLLSKLRPLTLREYYSHALQSGRLDGRKGGLSAQTVLHHHRVLHEALREAVQQGELARNVADAVKPPRPEDKEVEPLDEARCAWLLEMATGTRLYLPILLTICTGLRRGELLALTWDDVDLDAGWLWVRRALEETRQAVRFKAPKSKKGRRSVTLPAIAIEALREHQRHQQERKELLGEAYHDERLICCVEDGSLWKPSAFTSSYFSLLARRKFPRVSFHNLR